MVNYLSLVNHQGRLFINPIKPEQDGLIAVIDFKVKNKINYPVDIHFNSSGDSFLISDTRGSATLFLLANNRYCTIQADLKHAPPSVCFTGRYPQDQIFIALKDKAIQIHSLNGKCIDKFQPNLHHQMDVKNIDVNIKMAAFLTMSPDVCILWSNNQNQSISKLRSLYAKDGCLFSDAKFNNDGSKIATLFKDGEFILWSLDANDIDTQSLKFNFKTSIITQFETAHEILVATGQQCPFLIIKSLQGSSKDEYFKIPIGCRGIDKMQLMRDKNLLAFISEGYFYIVDLSTRSDNNKIKVKINIRIPNESIKTFDIDYNMTTVLLGTNNGNIYMYDLPKALENERILNSRRLKMGVEEELVYTYLEKVDEDMFLENINTLSFNTGMSQINSSPKQEASFLQSINAQQSMVQTIENPVQNSLNPFSSRSVYTGAYNQSQQNFQNASQYYMQSQQMPIVQSTQSKKRTLSKQFQEKDEHLNAGVPSIISSNAKFQKNSSIANYNKSTISVMSQNQKQVSIDENYQPDFKFTQSTINQQQLAQFNMPKLRQMLKQFGEYPEKYRTLTWKYLLDLPLNKESFSNLLRKGVHPAYKNLHKKYPISSYRLYNKLVRTLSALSYWCPLFLDVDYIPSIVFPFIKSIPNDDLLVFEIIVCFIMQYMQTWFESYPAEPIFVLQAVDQIIEREDSRLFSHLKSCSFTSSHYAWPLFQTLFSEILSKEDWLRLIDHIFTYKEDPELIVFFCASFLLTAKGQLQQIQTIDELHCFITKNSGISFKKIMTQAFKLHQKYKDEIITGNIANRLPLSKEGEYPLFTRYPEQIVSYQTKIREKILLEEEEIRKKEQLLIDLKSKAEEIIIQEEKFRKQQEAAMKAEADRKQKLQMEQEQMLQERIRLEEMTRIAKLEHIQRLEQALSNGFNYQEELKNQEAKLAEEEFAQRQRAAKYEYEARMQDELIANMEFKANQRLLEMMQQRQSEEQTRKIKSEFEQRQKEEEQRDRILQERWRLEDQEQRLKNELLRQTLAQQATEMQQQAERGKIDQKMRLQEYEKELQILRIEEQRRLRQMEEEQILRKQNMLEEMKSRSEHMQSQEAERLWVKLNEERIREREKAEERMRMLDMERQNLEMAIEREKEERERLDQLEREKQFEQEISNVYQVHNNEEKQKIEQLQYQMQQDREEAEKRRVEMMKKEIEIRESKDFMKFIRNTESKINDIVSRGQNNQEVRKLSKESEFEQKRRVEYEQRMRHQIEMRERQLKEYNDQQYHQMIGQQNFNKENIPTENNMSCELKPRMYTDNTSQNSESQENYSDDSLTSSKGDTQAIIQRHYKSKQAFENFKQQQQPSGVFNYQAMPNQHYQLQGYNLPASTITTNIEQRQPTQTIQDSYLSSSSSSNEEDDEEESYSLSNTSQNQMLHSKRNQQLDTESNQNYYSSYSQSELSSSIQSNVDNRIYH